MESVSYNCRGRLKINEQFLHHLYNFSRLNFSPEFTCEHTHLQTSAYRCENFLRMGHVKHFHGINCVADRLQHYGLMS